MVSSCKTITQKMERKKKSKMISVFQGLIMPREEPEPNTTMRGFSLLALVAASPA